MLVPVLTNEVSSKQFVFFCCLLCSLPQVLLVSVMTSRCSFRSLSQTPITWSYGFLQLENGEEWDGVRESLIKASQRPSSSLCICHRPSMLLEKCAIKFSTLYCLRILLTENCSYLYQMGSFGFRICTIRSVDGSNITSYCVHECDASSRMGSRPRRYLITGHSNGCLQVRNVYVQSDLWKRSAGENYQAKLLTHFKLVFCFPDVGLDHGVRDSIETIRRDNRLEWWFHNTSITFLWKVKCTLVQGGK